MNDYYRCSNAMTERMIASKTRSHKRVRQSIVRWLRKGGMPPANYDSLRVYECLFMN